MIINKDVDSYSNVTYHFYIHNGCVVYVHNYKTLYVFKDVSPKRVTRSNRWNSVKMPGFKKMKTVYVSNEQLKDPTFLPNLWAAETIRNIVFGGKLGTKYTMDCIGWGASNVSYFGAMSSSNKPGFKMRINK